MAAAATEQRLCPPPHRALGVSAVSPARSQTAATRPGPSGRTSQSSCSAEGDGRRVARVSGRGNVCALRGERGTQRGGPPACQRIWLPWTPTTTAPPSQYSRRAALQRPRPRLVLRHGAREVALGAHDDEQRRLRRAPPPPAGGRRHLARPPRQPHQRPPHGQVKHQQRLRVREEGVCKGGWIAGCWRQEVPLVGSATGAADPAAAQPGGD